VGRPTNTQFALGVHMLTLLGGNPGEVMSSETMAGSTGANPVHARRVLGRLRAAGLVASRPGVKGGWLLVDAPETIRLGDVWRALHADDALLGLHDANPDCTVGRSVQELLHDVDRRAARALEAELDRTTVGELLQATGTAVLRRVS
jgi:Rrf2 family protein